MTMNGVVFVEGGGSPTDGVVIAGAGGMEEVAKSRDYRSAMLAEEKRDAKPWRKPW
jgi:hypothetical protein